MSPEFRKVEALLALGRTDEAAALADSLPQRETPTPEYLRLRGRALRAAGRVFDAEAAFREALAMLPHEPGLLADLATTLMGQRRHREALNLAREAVQIRPDVAAYHCLVGVCAEALALDDEAERELRAARELAPGDAEAHTVYGWHALRSHRVADAEAAFRDALAIHPDRVEALRGLARAAADRGDWRAARAGWLEALAVDPRQRDRLLERSVLLGHPAMAPLVAATRVPIGVSVALAAAGAAFLVAFRGERCSPSRSSPSPPRARSPAQP
ncbi:MAG: tetratricopeptide repeat protein [Myxococcota bacterium]